MKKRQSFFWILTGCLVAAASLFSNGTPGTNWRSLPDNQRKTAIEAQNHIPLSETGGVISGTLYGLSADSWSTAWIIAWMTDGPDIGRDSLLYQHVTGIQEDGSYTISGLAAGEYYVEASADGYETLYYDNTKFLNDASIVTVTEQDTLNKVDFYMIELDPGTGSISGRVTDEMNGNPIDHAVVYAFSENYQYNGKSETDMEGHFEISELKSGSYAVYVMADSYITEYYEDTFSISAARWIVVEEPGTRSGIDFQMSRGSSISGTVCDSSGAPLRDFCVQAVTGTDSLPNWIEPYDARTGYYGSCTDSAGHYVIRDLPPGNFLIRGDLYTDWGMFSVYYPGVTNPDDAVQVEVGKGVEIDGIDFQVLIQKPSGIIRGRVTDAKGNPLEDAVISLGTYPVWRSAMFYWGSAVSDSDGYYSLEHIPDDTYTVHCSFYDGWQSVYYYWPGTDRIDEAQAVEISADSPVLDHIYFQLPVTVSRANISGMVRASDGHPLMNAIIRMESPEETAGEEKFARYVWAYSDSSGEYSATHVPQGSYTVKCEYYESIQFGEQWYDHTENPETASLIVIGENTQMPNVDFDLSVRPLFGSLSGIVMDQDNKPVENAYVEVIPRYTFMSSNFYYDYMDFANHTRTDAGGRYSFPELYHDDYRVAVYADGGYEIYADAIVWDDAETIAIAGGDSVTVDFNLEISEFTSSISGRITSEWIGWDDPGVEDSTFTAMGKTSGWLDEVFVVTAKPVITLLSWPESEKVYTTVSEPGGNYTISCPPGEYYVQAFSSSVIPEYYDNVYSTEDAKTVRTADGAPAENIDFVLYPKLYWFAADESDYRNMSNRIYGMVEDENGTPVSGAVIVLYDSEGNPLNSAMTDETGHFDFNGLNKGEYYIQADKQGIGTVFNGNVTGMENAEPLNMDQSAVEVRLVLNGTSAVHPADIKPNEIRLLGNYPNPFNPQTEIRFTLAGPADVSLIVYNILGKELYRTSGKYESGTHHIVWNGQDSFGTDSSSGVYFYRLETGMKTQTSKMILMR